MALEFRKASRKSVPLPISIDSVSGAGKTFTALLLAKGLAGPNGRVGFIDAENGRGEVYVDSPSIKRVYPDSYDYMRLDPPFSPERYTECVKAAESAGITVCIVDTFTHEWSGLGGCCDIAENNKLGGMANWSKAKLAHKRMVNHLLASNMHFIFCLRAHEKVKMFKKGDLMVMGAPGPGEYPIADRQCVVSQGVQAETEKNFVFEMFLSFYVEEFTHAAVGRKVPEPLQSLFSGKRVLGVEDGALIREWNDAGTPVDPIERAKKLSRLAAQQGMDAYKKFFSDQSKADQKILAATVHEENKYIAEQADLAAQQADMTPGQTPA
jgi:AAA domain